MHINSKTRLFFAAMSALAFAGACKKDRHNDVMIDQSGGEIALTWSPAGVQNVMNVPGAAVTSAIATKIGGAPPAPLAKDTWAHAQRLYKSYNGVPLWLTGDGIDKPRAGALMLALADAPSDGLKLN